MSATPAKAKKAAKPKKPAEHPKYGVMIANAITALKERKGSSRQAILNYLLKNFNVGKDAKAVNSRLKMALRRGVEKGTLRQCKGHGASGSFRLGEKKAGSPKKKAVKAKKPKSPKKAAKKPAAEGEKKVAKKAAKPKKAKSPKKAAKPKKAKSPKKPAAKKASKPKATKSKAKKSPKKASKKAAKK